MKYTDFFRGKKITVMGLGLLGRGIGDIRFLSKQGAHVLVTDLKTEEQLASSIFALKGLKNITYVLGEHRLEDFRNVDMIVKAAGIPLDSPYIAEARKAGIPIEMSTSLFARLSPAIIVGITGTRGKSTVTHLVYEILSRAYKGKKQKIYIGGNVRGVSTLELLPKMKKGDIIVLELDSWQLQGFGESKISPHIAVFTTLMTDHMAYYKGDMGQYFDDKANIYKFQKKGDTVIVGAQVDHLIKETKGKKVVVDETLLPKDWDIKIPGEHNKYNVSLAIAVARASDVSEEDIKTSVESFGGVPGRLEFLKEAGGIKIYNDNSATTPDATIAALKAVSSKSNVVLIMGGTDKKIDMSPLIGEIKKRCKAVTFFRESGTDMIKDKLFKLRSKKMQIIETEEFTDSVGEAFAVARKGDVILFSPAFASFGRFFQNEFDRGDQFVALANKLSKKLKK